MRVNELRQFNINGSTAAVANQPLLSKPINYWNTKRIFPFGFSGEGLYFKSIDREGFQFDVSEVQTEAGASSEIKSVALSPTLMVQTVKDGGDSNKLKVIAVSLSGTTPTAGTAVTLSTGAGTSVDLKRMSSTKFVVSYRDAGASSYAYVQVCTVSGTTITKGTAKAVTSAAINDTGTSLCVPRVDVVVIGYTLTSDSKGYAAGAVVSTTTVGDFTTAVAFEAGATKYPAMVSHEIGYFTVVYQDDGAANDPITYNLGECSHNGTVVFNGSAASMAGTAAAATLIDVVSTKFGEVVVSWVDSGKGHVRLGTINDTVPSVSWQDEVEVISASNTPASLSLTQMNSDKLILGYENDDVSDLGMVTIVDKSGTTLSAGQTDTFALASTANVSVCSPDGDKVAVFFMDDAASDVGKVIVGQLKEHLIDIRAIGASAAYDGFILHKNKAGLGQFAAYRISGTTNASADTAMASKPKLPFRKWPGVLVLFKDRGMYIEDDGSVTPYKSGVDTTNRELDVRSQATSEAFEAYVCKVMSFRKPHSWD